MGILWSGSINNNNILLFLTNAAPYMVKAGSILKRFYTKKVHATWTAHRIHWVAEEIQGQLNKVDDLIQCVKKLFWKTPKILLFKPKAPGIKFPPEPTVTRWVT